jgi:hypothetical protein
LPDRQREVGHTDTVLGTSAPDLTPRLESARSGSTGGERRPRIGFRQNRALWELRRQGYQGLAIEIESNWQRGVEFDPDKLNSLAPELAHQIEKGNREISRGPVFSLVEQQPAKV